jgi:hypothetical protein
MKYSHKEKYMNTPVPFKLFMISAMYENGGNVTHRMLDGHPELFVYPFESQLGTVLSANFIQTLVPFRYCWPEFPLHGEVTQDYELFFDEELKTKLRAPSRSKFTGIELAIDEAERKELFVSYMRDKERTRAHLVEAFFTATFQSWKNYQRTGQEKAYVGYSPVIMLDAEKILADMPQAHIIHVVRNPYSGYADTKKRPFPLALKKYAWTWNIAQHMALTYAQAYPHNVHLVRYEDLIASPHATMQKLSEQLGITYTESMLYPSWNGARMERVHPWGTIHIPTSEVNIATMNELSAQEKAEIRSTSIVMLKQFGYDGLC